MPGFKRLLEDGPCAVDLDNRQSTGDLYVKLYTETDARAFVVRWIFLRPGEAFTASRLRPGRYEVRYRDLDTGSLGRSDYFELGDATQTQPLHVELDSKDAAGRRAMPESDF
ncbi:MAG: hypothetical protein JO157_14680 [Acetobacteraceae bacterium]|nr:hypothetical protein [Acetobacteraceae bacterium]